MSDLGGPETERAARIKPRWFRATFDEHDHCVDEGWATYTKRWRGSARFHVRCRLGYHAVPLAPPVPKNGHSPSNYDRCSRCESRLGWFMEGQHRYGSLDRDTFVAYQQRREVSR